MNILDIVLLIPVVYGLIIGFQKGIFSQLAGLVGLVVAVFVSIKFSEIVADYLVENDISSGNGAAILGFVLTFVLVILAFRLVSKLLKKSSRAIGLGFLERLLGGIFGALKYYLVLIALLFFFLKINEMVEVVNPEVFEESVVYEYYQLGLDYLEDFWSKT